MDFGSPEGKQHIKINKIVEEDEVYLPKYFFLSQLGGINNEIRTKKR